MEGMAGDAPQVMDQDSVRISSVCPRYRCLVITGLAV